MTIDPRTHGIGAGDLVDVVVRGRVQRVGQMSMTLDVPTDRAATGRGAVEVWIPAEGIRAAVLAVPDPSPDDRCTSCGQSRSEHRLAMHAFTDDRGGAGLGPVLFALAIAVLAVLGFLSIAQEFGRSACESVAGTPAACEQAP